MEVINFFIKDFDVDTIVSGTNTKVTKEEILKPEPSKTGVSVTPSPAPDDYDP